MYVCVFHVAAVSAPVVHDVCRSISAPCHIMFLCSCLGSPCSWFGSRGMCVCRSNFPQPSRPTAAFSAPCQHCLVRCSRFDSHVHGLLSRLGGIGFVACHVIGIGLHMQQWEVIVCSACTSCPGLCCTSCHDLWPCAGAYFKQLQLFTCHVLLWCRWCEQTEASAIPQLVIRSLY